MKKFIIKLIVKEAKRRELKTPATDKLAHYYWGDVFDAWIGTILSSLLILIFGPYYIIGILPILINYLGGRLKEYSDGQGNGTKEKKDVWFTLKPSIKFSLFLTIIIYLLN